MKKLKIGVSACLIGFKYRYDGESRFSKTITEKLGGKVDLIPVCPEVECGLSIPRPKMHLEFSPAGTRLKVTETGADETMRMTSWIANKLEQLEAMGISGFLFQAKSPSCGLADTKIFAPGGKRIVTESGNGLFAAMLKKRFPRLVIGEERDIDEFMRSLGIR